MILHKHARRHVGFTLIELLVVISILALLASLTIGMFKYAQTAASRNRTLTTHKALMGGLEKYQADFGEYPEPTDPNAQAEFNNIRYLSGGAEMLYQAMSGDGTNAIRISGGQSTASDGVIDDTESPNMKMSDMPKDIWIRQGNRFYIVDGFRKPFQYTKGGDPQAVNPTYDLWSYGQDEHNTTEFSRTTKLNPQTVNKWITNW